MFPRWRRYPIALLVVGLLLAGLAVWDAEPAYTCSCEPPPELDEAIENAEYVFAGEAVDISDPDGDQYVTVRFSVTEAWKGVEHREIRVGTPAYSDACGYSFTEEREYLVYASENETRTGPDLITGICSRTDTLSTAEQHLIVLGTGTQADDLEPGEQTGDGLDLWMLFGSVALFLGIVVVITLLRRWR